MYKKYTSNSHIYGKNVQTVQNLYRVLTKNGLKLEMYGFVCTQTMYKLYKMTMTMKNIFSAKIMYNVINIYFDMYTR